MTLTPIEKSAIELIDLLATRREKYDAINAGLAALGGEFAPRVQLIDSEIEAGLVRFVDEALGLNDLASYYLYECVGKYGHGGGITCCGASKRKPFKLRNAVDLARYVAHAKKCPGMKGCAA